MERGIYDLQLTTEEVWGLSGNGDYGFDTVTLSYAGGGGPTLSHSIIAGIATKDFFIGSMGLTPHGMNFTDFNYPVPGILTQLKDSGQILGNSWAYTAGASYTPEPSFGSLVFGGYDLSRFQPNNLTIVRYEDISRDLLVGVQSITSGSDSLLPEGVVALIDSTVAQIWLPTEACQRFEEVFGLEWDNDLSLYTVNDTLHRRLISENPSITFTIGSTTTSNDIINVRLPYVAFDLIASWPLAPDGTRYFPLRRANDSTQYVLGRTFLQEAYVEPIFISPLF